MDELVFYSRIYNYHNFTIKELENASSWYDQAPSSGEKEGLCYQK